MRNKLQLLKDIYVWYVFSPRIYIWLTKRKSKTMFRFMMEETWDGGESFKSGCFLSVNLLVASLHIRMDWFRLKLEK